MTSILPFILAIAMIATVIVLFIGLISFASNSKFNAKHGNRLMRARVILQAVAIAIFLIFLLMSLGKG